MKTCYFCDKEQDHFNYVEWIPLLFRYVCICDNCHEEKGVGDIIHNINKYEEFLGLIGLGRIKLKEDENDRD